LTITAQYFLDKYFIKTNQFTKEMYIYKEGIWKPNGEYFIEQEILNIRADWLNKDRTEIIKKIQITTYFEKSPFDHKNIIVVENGSIHLDKLVNNEDYFLDFSEKDLVTNKIPVNYNPRAECPKINEFINLVTQNQKTQIDTDKFRKYLKEIPADILNNHYQSQKLHMLIGDGNNGKGTYLRLLENFFGLENFTTLGLEYLYEGSFQTYILENSMFNAIGDTNDHYVRDTGFLKKLSGEDYFSCNIKNVRKPYQFHNKSKMILASQYGPKSNEDNTGWWRRFTFSDWLYTIPEEEQKPDYEKELTTENEKSGFLNLVLASYIEFYHNKFKFSLDKDLKIEDLRKINLLKSNPIKLFFEIIVQDGDEETDFFVKKDLFKIYDFWSEENNARKYKENAFHRAIKKEFPDLRQKLINDHRSYRGIRLTNLGNEYFNRINVHGITYTKSLHDKLLDSIKAVKNAPQEISTLLFKLNLEGETDEQKIRDELDQLLQNGEIYEPRPGYFQSFSE